MVLRRIEIRVQIPPTVLAALPGVEKQLAELHGDVWITLLNEAVSKETAPPLDLDDLGAIFLDDDGSLLFGNFDSIRRVDRHSRTITTVFQRETH